jgi:hypothetical protein
MLAGCGRRSPAWKRVGGCGPEVGPVLARGSRQNVAAVRYVAKGKAVFLMCVI